MADLSSFLSWRLAYERKAGVQSLFTAAPPFPIETEIYHLMWWRGIEALRLAPDLMSMIEGHRREIGRVVALAKEKGNAAAVLPYVQELRDEVEAASLLIKRLTDGRV